MRHYLKESSSLDPSTVYHLDSNAIYRKEWQTAHINMKNDAIMQIVSVFAIGFNKHFSAETGSDASVTNSNSNFGQIHLHQMDLRKMHLVKMIHHISVILLHQEQSLRKPVTVDWQSLDVGLDHISWYIKSLVPIWI